MKLIQRVRIGLAASALGAFLTVSIAGTANAGSLQIHDPEHVLSAEDAGRLRSVVDSAPFDGKLAVTSEYGDSQELSRYVASLVREPNVVVVGLDTVHRHVQVHFGEGDAIARSDWPSIERAGNDAFSRRDWESGTAAIFQTAARSALAHGGQPVQPAGNRAPSLFGPGLLLILLIGGLGLALLFARRRAAMNGPYPSEYRGYGTGYGPGPGPGYGPGYPPPGGMGPVGGGIIGAGLGGLAGYELGKYEGEREGRSREERSSFNDDGGNYDTGGGGSSWDDNGGGGGGFDGGGGGNDGGGGGNDGGGGGSDF